MKHMYRIHTDSPRRFLIVQKNPESETRVGEEVAWLRHAHLNEWGGAGKRNIAHS